MVKKEIASFSVEYLQVVDENGIVDESLMPDISDDEIKAFYEQMVLVRVFDDKAFNLQRQGRIGTYIQFKGQEASQVGTAKALKDSDWMFPMYRSHAALITRQYPPHKILQISGGDERGFYSDGKVRNFPVSIAVGTQTPHATGCAWASKLKGEDDVSLVYMGDGATSKADFYSGLNFAGVKKVPAIFVCENNQYAISVPRKKQTAAETIAQKAIAAGIHGIQIDGMDIFAVYKVTKEAVEHARKGEGPTLIEAVVYRMCDHSTSDDAHKYRSEDEEKQWAEKGPLVRLEKFMRSKGLLDDTSKEAVWSKAKEAVEKEVEIYEKIEDPDPKDMFMYTFEEPTDYMKEQMKDFD